MIRPVWLMLGSTAFALGAVGVFLPLLPTVPFLLLAAYCFARSSERLHGWLLSHPVFGPPIHDWRERGAIRRRAKLAASISIFAAFGLAFVFQVPAGILALQAGVLSVVAIFIWTRPEA